MKITIITICVFFTLLSSSFAKDHKVMISQVKVSKKILALKAKKVNDTYCLATNVYHEARGESFVGQMAVALVTLERTQSEFYPKSVCEVVKQPHAFSWTSSRKKVIKDKNAFQQSYLVANLATVVKSLGLDLLRSDHFHSKHLKRYPRWAFHFEHVATIGSHTFYRSNI